MIKKQKEYAKNKRKRKESSDEKSEEGSLTTLIPPSINKINVPLYYYYIFFLFKGSLLIYLRHTVQMSPVRPYILLADNIERH